MDNAEPRDLPVEQILSDVGMASPQGPPSPVLFVSSSAETLSDRLSDALSIPVAIPSSGEGTYLGACMGLKPSGGFSVRFESARLEGTQVTICLDVQEPGPDSFAITVITSPFAVAVIRDLDPRDKNFSVGELDWQVVHVDG